MTFRNVIERACVLATGASVEITDAFEAPAAALLAMHPSTLRSRMQPIGVKR